MPRPSGDKKSAESFKHVGDTCKNIPTTELQSGMKNGDNENSWSDLVRHRGAVA
jgi:hypothetical protein